MATVKRARKLYEVVIDELNVFIQSEGLRNGDKLPTERELGGMLGVSRTPLREALMVMQNEGRLVITQGRGIFLSDPGLTDRQADAAHTQVALIHLQEARRVVECAIVRLAAERARPEDIDRMEHAIAQVCAEGGAISPIDADYEFHYALAQAAGNPVLAEVLKQVDAKLHSGRKTTLAFPKGRLKALRAHSAIFEAVLSRDPALAERAMQAHLDEILGPQKRIHALKEEPSEP